MRWTGSSILAFFREYVLNTADWVGRSLKTDEMASLEPYENVIREMITQNFSYADISTNLSELGVKEGCSAMSVRRFCARHNISRRGHESDSQLEAAISSAINQVGFFCFLWFTEVGSYTYSVTFTWWGFWISCTSKVVLHHLHTFYFYLSRFVKKTVLLLDSIRLHWAGYFLLYPLTILRIIIPLCINLMLYFVRQRDFRHRLYHLSVFLQSHLEMCVSCAVICYFVNISFIFMYSIILLIGSTQIYLKIMILYFCLIKCMFSQMNRMLLNSCSVLE